MAEVVTAYSLRRKLHKVAGERARAAERRRVLEERAGELLADVRETPGITIEEACQLLGVSKPTAYRLLKAAA